MRPLRLAEAYDAMASNLFPYEQIAAHLSARLQHYRPPLWTILDIACGTGNLTLPLAQLGYQVSGLDVSPEMLALAQEKGAAKGLKIPFLCHDMRQAYPHEPVEGITCFYGGLNFLTTSEALRQALAAAYAALLPGGLLAFDQFSESKMRATFNGLKVADFGDFYVSTRSRCDAAGQIVHSVTYFLPEADGRYRREEELQRLRLHPLPEIQRLLAETGFSLLAVESFYPQLPAEALQDTLLFIAQKP